MTPEERKLIEEAIYLRYCIDAKTAGDPPRIGRLLDAVDALIFSCYECNAGGHTCPGDGMNIPHGAVNCGRHDEDFPIAIEPVEPAPDWIMSEWQYVLTDDRVRIGQQEAEVTSSDVLNWHVDTETYGRPAWPHRAVRMKLKHLGDEWLPFPPGAPVEILCNRERAAALLLQTELDAKVIG